MVTSDEELLQRVLTADQNALRTLIDRYKAYVFAIILNLLPGSSDTEDIAQEVFLQVYNSLPDYRPRNFKAWLGKIALNKTLDWKRSHSKYNRHEILDIGYLADENESRAPDLLLIKNEKHDQVREICRQLPPIYGQIIQEYYFESRSYAEIAQHSGVSVKTVESRLYRARAMIKQKWKEDGS
ncbi:MAG TPA: RNA polymerase sigma factor [Syntrophomonadaceae bacterium]|nr:RNA polymerase sigma factor [Syntrophomonadaceae bacterium]HPR94275.1 RNA polymerase sigma factor [Syntrophomonadaceae bacterium]